MTAAVSTGAAPPSTLLEFRCDEHCAEVRLLSVPFEGGELGATYTEAQSAALESRDDGAAAANAAGRLAAGSRAWISTSGARTGDSFNGAFAFLLLLTPIIRLARRLHSHSRLPRRRLVVSVTLRFGLLSVASVHTGPVNTCVVRCRCVDTLWPVAGRRRESNRRKQK